MGSFNEVCQLSHRVIAMEDRTVLMILAENFWGNPMKSKVIYNTDYYFPISFPFITRYSDYGKHRLDPEFEKNNQLSWDSLLNVGLNHLKYLDVDAKLYQKLKSLESDVNVGFPKLIKIVEDNDLLSKNCYDYHLYQTIINEYKENPFKKYSKETRKLESVFLGEEIKKYMSSDLKTQVLNNQYGYPVGFDINLIGVREKSSETRLYYQYLLENIENNLDNLELFVDNCLFFNSLSALHVPFTFDSYGGQNENSYEQVIKIKGEIEYLRSKLIHEFEAGMSGHNFNLLFPKQSQDSLSIEEAQNLIDKLSLELILGYYTKSDKYL